jgi:hypothetical protein
MRIFCLVIEIFQSSTSFLHSSSPISYTPYQLTYILFSHHNFHLLSLSLSIFYFLFFSFISSLRRSLSHFLPWLGKLQAGATPPFLPPPGKPQAGAAPPLLSTLPPARHLSLYSGARPAVERPW